MDASMGEGETPIKRMFSTNVDLQNDNAKPQGVIETPWSEKTNSNQNSPPDNKAASAPRTGRRGGPRTPVGKERSRGNALKHGIFSRAVLLDHERWEQFDSLLEGLRKDLQPVGMLEKMLVDKLASLMWRYRRMLVAERAEIRLGKRVNPVTAERDKQQREEALLFSSAEMPDPGLISRMENPLIRDRIMDLLKLLQMQIQINGFNPEHDRRILKIVYGQKMTCAELWIYGLCNRPVTKKDLKELNLTPGQCKALEEFELPPTELKAKFIQCLKEWIDGIRRYGECLKFIPAQTERLERGCAEVPEGPRLDRLLRYEASLDRAFDRTLNQLERLQRRRKGEAVPAPISANVSLS